MQAKCRRVMDDFQVKCKRVMDDVQVMCKRAMDDVQVNCTSFTSLAMTQLQRAQSNDSHTMTPCNDSITMTPMQSLLCNDSSAMSRAMTN